MTLSSSAAGCRPIQPADDEARPFDETDRSRAFGAPTAYQEPLTLRFGLKATF